MHEYQNSPIAKLMKKIADETPGQFRVVSEEDLHIACEVLRRLPSASHNKFIQILVLGTHESPIASALGATGYWVLGVCFMPAYLMLQNRQRRVAVSHARFIKSTYEDLSLNVIIEFDNIIVLQNVDFNRVRDLCLKKLKKGGVIAVAQPMPYETDDETATYLKKTGAGYCIGCEKDAADWVVFSVRRAVEEPNDNEADEIEFPLGTVIETAPGGETHIVLPPRGCMVGSGPGSEIVLEKDTVLVLQNHCVLRDMSIVGAGQTF